MTDTDVQQGSVCTRCVLTSAFPGIRFDARGLCNYCAESPPPVELEARRQALKERMDRAIAEKRGGSQYDCIVAFSGGKDSSYALVKLVRDYQLKCLAVTIDNGFVSPRAVENCRNVTRSLGVDFQMFTPSSTFMNRLYLASATEPDVHAPAAMKRASSMCNSCIGLINSHMVKLAVQADVPMIAGGYIGGQVPKDAAMLEVDLLVHRKTREATLERYITHFGKEARRYFEMDSVLVERSRGRTVTVLNPLLAFSVSEEEIIKEVERFGWVRTTDTGLNSSNCLLNDLGIFVHHRQHHFHPYAFELSERIRAGLMTREEALKRVQTLPSAKDVEKQASAIGLKL